MQLTPELSYVRVAWRGHRRRLIKASRKHFAIRRLSETVKGARRGEQAAATDEPTRSPRRRADGRRRGMSAVLVPVAKPVVLVVDDVAANRELLEGYLYDLGYDVRQARDGIEALEQIEAEEPDLVLLDIDMPRLDGIALCQRIKSDPVRRLIPVVLITGLSDRRTRLKGLEVGADDFITKPFDAKELLVRSTVLLRDRALNKRLDAAENIILALARVIELRDLYTVHHAERVGLFSREIGKAYGLSDEEDLDYLYQGGVLHDVGKSVVALSILLKNGELTSDEREVMERHAAEGAHICAPLRSTAIYLSIVRHHHERYDGQGYPDHLAAADIPIGARIAAIADGWDAMTSDRPYRGALSRDEALRRLRSGAGGQWDPAFVEVFEGLMTRGVVDAITRGQLERGTAPSGEAAAGRPTRVLLVDDNSQVLEGLRASVGAEPDLTVVGEARDGEAALELALRRAPDVVVLDSSMPLLTGVQVARILTKVQASTGVVVYTADEDAGRSALEAGATAVVRKGTPLSELLQSIRSAAKGGKTLVRMPPPGADARSPKRRGWRVKR